jgi:hypothetical protein
VIDELFCEGSDEKVKALELRPSLDEAQQKHAEAVALFEVMQKATRPNDIAKNFIPVSTAPSEQDEGDQPSVIKRPVYDKLSLVNRALFVKSGGRSGLMRSQLF